MGMGANIPGNPRSYDEYLKAYSVAMMPGKERLNVSYGGKSASNVWSASYSGLNPTQSLCQRRHLQVYVGELPGTRHG